MENKSTGYYISLAINFILLFFLVFITSEYRKIERENRSISSDMNNLELYIYEEQVEVEDILKRINKIEEAVFKKTR